MIRFKVLINSCLCICLLCLISVSALAQCFNNYTLSPSGNICGGSATMTLSGSQSGVTYQLQVNGSNYGSPVNGTGSSITVGTVTSSSSGGGGTFLVVASQFGSSCSPTVISGAGVTFVPTPGGTVTASSSYVCSGSPVTFTVNPTAPGSYNYQWFLNGPAIPGATSPTYSASVVGTYTVQISNTCGAATLPCPTINAAPNVGAPGSITGPLSRVAGAAGSSTYTVGGAANAVSYLWEVSPAVAGTFNGTGTATASFNWNPDFSGTAIIRVRAIGNCGPPSGASLLPVSVDLPASSGYSYLKETDVRVPNIVSATSLAALPIGQKKVTITYEDQEGRPIQTVMQSASPGMNDVIQPAAYDPVGRPVTTYLPYTAPGTNNGSYVTNPLTNQAIYYNPSTPGAPNIATSTNSTSQSGYDNSPLERVVEKGYPGSTWIQGGGHSVQNGYGANAPYEVVYWILNTNGNGAYASTYNSGMLLSAIVTDENGNSVTQYTDFSGKMVCKKVQNGPSTYLNTYYVYDNAGNLRYVIPPLPTVPVAVSLPSSFVETDAVFTNFFYGYHYDGRNRLTEKKVPGKGWEYYVYNRLDQVVLSQTSTQTSLGLWTFTKYDSRGRAILTGDYTTASLRGTLQSAADSFSSALLWESFSNSTSNYGYTDVSYPDNTVSSSKKVLSASYYDNYSFLSNSSINPNTAVFTAPSADTILNSPEGLTTGSITNVLGAPSTTYLLSINHYDTYGRTVKTVGQSYKTGGTNSGNYDIIQNQYSFDNSLVKSTRTHYLSSALLLTINTFYGYDHSGRKILLQQQYDSGPLINLAEYDYNELGQLYRKSLHAPGQPAGVPSAANITLGTADAISSGTKMVYASNSIVLQSNFSVSSGATFKASIIHPYLQTINYSYNIRGWLTKINDPNSLGTSLFAEQVDYDQPNTSFSGTTPQFNGNISTMSWQTLAKPNTSMVQELKGYVYNYDGLNRLTASYYKAPSGNDTYNEVISYDELGNILSLNRNATASTFLNKLAYNYGSGTQRGNLLLSVADNGGTENYASTFSYQSSGSETANTKTGVQQIIYNELNLPSLITFTSGKTISFAYSSSGEEFERIIKQGTTVSEDRSYIHGIEYVGNTINFIHTEEGRVRPITGGYLLEYQVVDHLGNVRAMFGDEDNSGSFSAANDIVQTTDYYAFGRQIAYLDANPQYQYKFNGKEYSSDLNEYNYGARYLNPATARWNAIDNDADKSRRWSPYSYAYNNPVRNIDPDGNFSYDYSTAYANAVSSDISRASQFSYFREPEDYVYDYEHGFTSYDPTPAIMLKQAMNDMAHDLEKNNPYRGHGSDAEDGGDFYSSLNSSGSSGHGGGLGNFLLHLTPFGGIIDFTNAAKQDNVGGAVLGLASTAAFFTGEGAFSSVNGSAESSTSTLGEGMSTLYRNLGPNERNSINSLGGFSTSANSFDGKQFWIGDSGLTMWKNSFLAKPYDIKVTIPTSYITPGHPNYLFNEPPDPFFNGQPSIDNFPGGTVLPQNLGIFNSVIKWEWLH
ncbi:DUF6443 domain-containing protein [Mucilaginibacter sp. OK098]|uniref:DUF6443 domain-containing protein n=1 Tax=Mucilaginibacter sp. OK098 TaxID=1855297 RepID=UPI00091B3F44|nr:DUF6443 domain-containing protein [Mucilaginibacter sp. OK098]SHN12258.1 RHS repeat-associated core domain-containing protein [Mucilaginibacter sp. OK098]